MTIDICDQLTNACSRNRDKKWDSMTKEEKEEYLATTKDKGNKRYAKHGQRIAANDGQAGLQIRFLSCVSQRKEEDKGMALQH